MPPSKQKTGSQFPAKKLEASQLSAVCLKNRQLLTLGHFVILSGRFIFGGRSTVGLWVKLSFCQKFFS